MSCQTHGSSKDLPITLSDDELYPVHRQRAGNDDLSRTFPQVYNSTKGVNKEQEYEKTCNPVSLVWAPGSVIPSIRTLLLAEANQVTASTPESGTPAERPSQRATMPDPLQIVRANVLDILSSDSDGLTSKKFCRARVLDNISQNGSALSGNKLNWTVPPTNLSKVEARDSSQICHQSSAATSKASSRVADVGRVNEPTPDKDDEMNKKIDVVGGGVKVSTHTPLNNDNKISKVTEDRARVSNTSLLAKDKNVFSGDPRATNSAQTCNTQKNAVKPGGKASYKEKLIELKKKNNWV
jgi:hypothetical protein